MKKSDSQTCWCLSSPSYSSSHSCWRHGDDTTVPGWHDCHTVTLSQSTPASLPLISSRGGFPSNKSNKSNGTLQGRRQLTSDPKYCWPGQVCQVCSSWISKSQVGKSQINSHIKWSEYWRLTLRFVMVRRGPWHYKRVSSSYQILIGSSPSLLRQFSWSTYTRILLL